MLLLDMRVHVVETNAQVEAVGGGAVNQLRRVVGVRGRLVVVHEVPPDVGMHRVEEWGGEGATSDRAGEAEERLRRRHFRLVWW